MSFDINNVASIHVARIYEPQDPSLDQAMQDAGAKKSFLGTKTYTSGVGRIAIPLNNNNVAMIAATKIKESALTDNHFQMGRYESLTCFPLKVIDANHKETYMKVNINSFIKRLKLQKTEIYYLKKAISTKKSDVVESVVKEILQKRGVLSETPAQAAPKEIPRDKVVRRSSSSSDAKATKTFSKQASTSPKAASPKSLAGTHEQSPKSRDRHITPPDLFEDAPPSPPPRSSPKEATSLKVTSPAEPEPRAASPKTSSPAKTRPTTPIAKRDEPKEQEVRVESEVTQKPASPKKPVSPKKGASSRGGDSAAADTSQLSHPEPEVTQQPKAQSPRAPSPKAASAPISPKKAGSTPTTSPTRSPPETPIASQKKSTSPGSPKEPSKPTSPKKAASAPTSPTPETPIASQKKKSTPPGSPTSSKASSTKGGTPLATARHIPPAPSLAPKEISKEEEQEEKLEAALFALRSEADQLIDEVAISSSKDYEKIFTETEALIAEMKNKRDEHFNKEKLQEIKDLIDEHIHGILRKREKDVEAAPVAPAPKSKGPIIASSASSKDKQSSVAPEKPKQPLTTPRRESPQPSAPQDPFTTIKDRAKKSDARFQASQDILDKVAKKREGPVKVNKKTIEDLDKDLVRKKTPVPPPPRKNETANPREAQKESKKILKDIAARRQGKHDEERIQAIITSLPPHVQKKEILKGLSGAEAKEKLKESLFEELSGETQSLMGKLDRYLKKHGQVAFQQYFKSNIQSQAEQLLKNIQTKDPVTVEKDFSKFLDDITKVLTALELGHFSEEQQRYVDDSKKPGDPGGFINELYHRAHFYLEALKQFNAQ